MIRKDGLAKAMDILHDAYPDSAGIDIMDLVKTTDLDALYDCLTVYNEWDPSETDGEVYPDEPEPFAYDTCRLAVKNGNRLWISQGTEDRIRNSIDCEYAYAADLDTEELLFFVGGQTQPQEENPYGTVPIAPHGMKTVYYPCRLAAVIPFEVIKRIRSEQIAQEMELAEEDSGGIRRLCPETEPDGASVQEEYLVRRKEITGTLSALDDRIRRSMDNLQELYLTSRNRIRELVLAVNLVDNAVCELERKIEIIKPNGGEKHVGENAGDPGAG